MGRGGKEVGVPVGESLGHMLLGQVILRSMHKFDCVDHNKLWKILKVLGIPDHFTWLLRNLYAGQEATVKTRQEKWTGSKLGKEYIKAVYCHSVYLTYIQSTSCKMPG